MMNQNVSFQFKVQEREHMSTKIKQNFYLNSIQYNCNVGDTEKKNYMNLIYSNFNAKAQLCSF